MIAVFAAFLLIVGWVAYHSEDAQAATFYDTPTSEWYVRGGYLDFVVDNGIMTGIKDSSGAYTGRFDPNGNVTRGMVATVLYRVANPTSTSTTDPALYGTSQTFADVPSGEYYTSAVEWCSKHGIVTGYTDDEGNAIGFGPNDFVTREQLATMLWRFACGVAGVALSAQPDGYWSMCDVASVDGWAEDAMAWCFDQGILTGVGGVRLDPQGLASRCQMAKMIAVLLCGTESFPSGVGSERSIVARPSEAGALHVEGTQLVGEDGLPVQLRGVSTHGIAWFPQYVNPTFFSELSSWGSNAVRLAMYTGEYGGYLSGGDQAYLRQLVANGVEWAAEADMYAIVDWHVLSEGDPNKTLSGALTYFDQMSALLSGYNNVVYEICNEPNGGATWAQVKSYAEQVIPVIRANDPDAVIIVGTPEWSQRVDSAMADPLAFDNVMYALHFYAATHTDWLRTRCREAIAAGLPVFVSEYGICDASGNGVIDEWQANQWVAMMDELGISYMCWNISNKGETSAIFNTWCSKSSGFTYDDLSASGKWLLNVLGSSSRIVGSPAAPPEPGTGTTGIGMGPYDGFGGDEGPGVVEGSGSGAGEQGGTGESDGSGSAGGSGGSDGSGDAGESGDAGGSGSADGSGSTDGSGSAGGSDGTGGSGAGDGSGSAGGSGNTGGEALEPQKPSADGTVVLSCGLSSANSWESEGKKFVQYNVGVSNDSTADVTSWTVELVFSADVTIDQCWGAAYEVDGQTVRLSNVEYNGSIARGAKVGDVGLIVSGPAGFTVECTATGVAASA